MSIERWEIASSSEIHFTVRHLLLSKVRGRFSRWSGTVLVPDGDWGRATVDVVIDASSIDTGIPKRDTDLRSANFLDVERYPDITFRTLYVTARQADRVPDRRRADDEGSGGRGDARGREQRRHSRSRRGTSVPDSPPGQPSAGGTLAPAGTSPGTTTAS